MSNQSKGNAKGNKASVKGGPYPRSSAIAENGVNTSADFRNLMSALMSDVIQGRVTPSVTNAACNASGKMLRMVELEMKYGTNPERGRRSISLAFESGSETTGLLEAGK